MRKRLVFLNALVVFVSLFIVLTCSTLITSSVRTSDAERRLKSYLPIAQEVLAQDLKSYAPDEAAGQMADTMISGDSAVYVTVIADDGTVIFDSWPAQAGTDYLTLPEIESPGTIVYRYSSARGANIMYAATADLSSSYYIRLSLPQPTISSLAGQIIGYGTLALAGIMLISAVAVYFLTRKAMKPLKEQADRLASLVNKKPLGEGGDEIESISYEIDEAQTLLEDKISSLTAEKEKLDLIINSIGQGLIIVSSDLNVLMMNKAAEKIFSLNRQKVIGQPIVYVTIKPNLLDLIEEASRHRTERSLTYEKEDGHSFAVSVLSISASWCASGGRFGVGVFFTDMTSQKILENAKRDFFANASHELKSPLTSIIGYVQLIKSGMITSKEEIDQSLTRVLSEAKRMNDIIVQMLELTRLENNIPGLSPRIELKKAIEDVIDSLGQEAKAKNISVSLTGSGFGFRIAREDADSLFRNLVENAIRYNKADGKVDISLKPEERKVIVSDTGIGIAKEDQTRIFERFYRVDKAKSRKLGGTGLGLSIVKHLCLNYRIDIQIKSELGRGSEFTLVFPKESK